VCRFLMQRGWQIVEAGVEVAHVQVDILARDPQGVLTLIEVKSASHMAHLSAAQQRRLFRASSVLAGFEPVQLILALEDAGVGEVELLPVDGLTV
jgi:Holliday junction resolvase-like predicted endonuclease